MTTEKLVDVHVQVLGAPNPIYLTGMTETEALKWRDLLTTAGEWDWVDIEHRGRHHRINTAHVGTFSTSPAWTPPVRQGNVLEQEDGSYVADGSDPQIPLGTPVTIEGEPLDNPDGHFS